MYLLYFQALDDQAAATTIERLTAKIKELETDANVSFQFVTEKIIDTLEFA